MNVQNLEEAQCPSWRGAVHEDHTWYTSEGFAYKCPGVQIPVISHAHHVTPDMVNHPPHYHSHPSGVACIDIVEHFNFNIGNAVKYLWREGLKGDSTEDLKKAVWYINREIERRGRDNAIRANSPDIDAGHDSGVRLSSGTSTPGTHFASVQGILPDTGGPSDHGQRGS